MFMLDPTRDVALCNKADELLDRDFRVPPSWYDPVPNNGMTRDNDGKWLRPK